MPGPLPNDKRRRRNAPTIPTTVLPLDGFSGPVPKVPPFVELGKAGRAWWRWAWTTPQAAAWSPGHEVAIARRASLEDDMTVQSTGSPGKLALLREINSLEDRLGLTPKAMAALRWTIGEPEPERALAPVVDVDRFRQLGA